MSCFNLSRISIQTRSRSKKYTQRERGREREGGGRERERVLLKLLDVATVVSAITPMKSRPIKSRLSASWLSSSLCLPFLLSLAPALVLFLLPRGRSSLPPWVTHPPYLGHNPPANRIPLVKFADRIYFCTYRER